MLSIYYILLIFLLLFGAKTAPAGQFHEDANSSRSDLPLRGFLMLVIVLHHLSQQLKHPGSMKLLWGAGIICVSFFFYLSGYGLMKNYIQKEDYFHAFFKRRYSKLFLPFFVCNLIYLCVNMQLGISYTPRHFIKCLIGLELVNTHAWFILTIALFYLAFFLIFRFVRKRFAQYFLLALFQAGYAAFCMQKGNGIQLFEGPWWFNSSFLFLMGVLFAGFEPVVNSFFRKYYRLLVPLSVPVFLLFYFVSVYVTNALPYQTQEMSPLSPMMWKSWFNLVWQSLAAVSFCLVVTLFSMKVKCSNPILTFLGKVSLELYLIHGLYIRLFRGQLCTIDNDFLFIAAVIFCSVCSAYALYYPLNAMIQGTRLAMERGRRTK